MTDSKPVHELARDIEHYLELLSKLYVNAGEQRKLAIIANARVTISEGWNYDNWNGGTYGHAVFLALPHELFIACIPDKDSLQSEIARDINKVHNVVNESIDEVFLEALRVENHDWRRDSGALLGSMRAATPAAADRIWGATGYRVFLSHKTEVKRQTSELKSQLEIFGCSAFVAHEDIHPTKAWQDEIESALATMDAFVALLTDGFHDSLWTDQEVGFAVGRGIPIIAVRLGRDPYGFIGKFQAMACDWANAPLGIVRLLITQGKMVDEYLRSVEGCTSFDSGNTLSQALPGIQTLSVEQADRLVNAYNANPELRGSFGFNGARPRHYGHGLQAHLLRTIGRRYEAVDGHKLTLASPR